MRFLERKCHTEICELKLIAKHSVTDDLRNFLSCNENQFSSFHSRQVQSYVKCAEFIAEEECEMEETSYVEDHEVLSILPLCRHKYVYES